MRSGSTAATLATYTLPTRCAGAESLRRGRRGSAGLHLRRRQNAARGCMIATHVGGAAVRVTATDSKKLGSLPWIRGVFQHVSQCRRQAASVCSTLRLAALACRDHRQRSWHDSDTAGRPPVPDFWATLGVYDVRVFSGVPGLGLVCGAV